MIESRIQPLIPGFEININVTAYLKSILSWFAENLNYFFSSVVTLLLDGLVLVTAMFFLYRDGQKLHDFAVKWSPLADNYDETIISKLGIAVSSVVKGSLVTAIIQGALVSLGFLMFGVSNPVLWGVVSAIFALLPLVGTGMIVLPASAYLFFEHHYWPAIGLTIWWSISVAVVEHMVKPVLMQRDIDIHPLAILLSVLGGLTFFGPVGFLAGPIVLAFFFALLDIYPAIVAGKRLPDAQNEV
jgi:predicted PurR-regulated permease PerM